MIDTIAPATGSGSVETTRLLRSPLSSPLLGEPTTLDLMARNGFRHLSVGATADPALLAHGMQRFRNLARVNVSVSRKQSVRTICEGHLDGDAVLRDVARLENARHRLAAELFWPHVQSDEFQTVVSAHDIRGLMALGSAMPGGEPRRVLHRHAEALVAWCIALDAEIEFVERRAGSMAGVWEKALALWAEVCASRAFWAYFEDRVRVLDDPLVQSRDVKRAREEVPAVVLGVHEVLAEHYASAGDDEHALRHLRLLRGSGFDGAHVRAANSAALRRVVAVRLEEPLRRVRAAIAGFTGRVARKKFDATMAPLLNEVSAVRSVLASRFDMADDQFDQSTFDQVADEIRVSLDNKIDYKNDDRERSILYGSLVHKRMLTWPLSAVCRRRIEHALRDNDGYLFTDYGLVGPTRVDATACFFIDGEVADPDASLVVPLYKVTGRQIQIDRAAGSAGVRVQYTAQRLLIPRSVMAKSHTKGGHITVQVREQDCTPAQAGAFASLRALEAEKADRLDSQARAIEQEQQAVRRRTAAKLTVAEEAARPKRKEATDALAREDQKVRELLAAEKQRLEQARAAVEREHGPAVQAAVADAKRQQAWLGGLPSYLTIEGPVFALATIALWFWSGRATALVLGGGTVVALIVGRLVRQVVERRALAALAGPTGIRDAALAAADTESDRRQVDIRAAADKRRAPWKGVDKALEAEKKQIEAKGQQRLAELAQAGAQERADLEKAFAERAKAIKGLLQRSVEAKKESDKTTFPGYTSARQKGFKEGSEPSSYEMKMTDAERRQALMALQLR